MSHLKCADVEFDIYCVKNDSCKFHHDEFHQEGGQYHVYAEEILTILLDQQCKVHCIIIGQLCDDVLHLIYQLRNVFGQLRNSDPAIAQFCTLHQLAFGIDVKYEL